MYFIQRPMLPELNDIPNSSLNPVWLVGLSQIKKKYVRTKNQRNMD